MKFSIWGKPKEEARAFHEKLFRRGGLPQWDARWHQLSVPARAAFLHDVKRPGKYQAKYGSGSAPSISVDKLRPEVLDELTRAGFVEVKTPSGKLAARVFAAEDLSDFASRIRALERHHLLDPDRPSQLSTYLNACFSTSELHYHLQQLLREAGIEDYAPFDEVLRHYIPSPRWSGWVSQHMKDPLADRIVATIRAADRPVLLSELPGRLAGEPPEKVRR